MADVRKRATGLMLVLAGGCASVPAAGPMVTYACAGGPDLAIRYGAGVARILRGPGRGATMPQQPSGSGFRHESETHSIRGKGDELVYTASRMAPITCQAKR